jgi:hypothetical protein
MPKSGFKATLTHQENGVKVTPLPINYCMGETQRTPLQAYGSLMPWI